MAKKLWGGRFSKATDPLVEQFTQSVQYDQLLGEFDCIGSILHVLVLKKSGYLKAQEAGKLVQGLVSVYKKACAGTLYAGQNVEDIHTLIQNALQKQVGPLVGKLHTARSRNDQVTLATKLYCRSYLLEACVGLAQLMEELDALAGRNEGLVVPGFTHMQHAQPVLLKDHLAAYSSMLSRDYTRLKEVHDSIRLTFGAGALAGTPIPAEHYRVSLPQQVKKQLGIKEDISLEPCKNSLDAVSDRDFVLETIFAVSVCAMHLSRMAEDMIIWSTQEFGFVELDDAYCTGSSLMPQKKNADVLELARGYASRICGNLVSVLGMMKGLPLTYNRDMQLDKEPLFASIEVLMVEVAVMQGVVRTMRFNKQRIAASLAEEGLYATDLVYYLVGKGVPFASAHEAVGKLVQYSAAHKVSMKDIPAQVFKGFSPALEKAQVLRLLDPVVSVKGKKSILR